MSSNQHSETDDWINTVVQQYERPLVCYAAQITGDYDQVVGGDEGTRTVSPRLRKSHSPEGHQIVTVRQR